MSPREGRDPQQFRVTVEGVTRYVTRDLSSGDVTLTLPGGGMCGEGTTIKVGGMDLSSVEWIVEPPQVGDHVSTSSAEHLPPDSIVARRIGGLPLWRRRDGKWLMAGSSEVTGTWSFDVWGDVEVLRVGGQR